MALTAGSIIPAENMDTVYYELAHKALDFLEQSQSYRVVILIGGTPGSGKSTVAGKVCELLNEMYDRKHGTTISTKQKLRVKQQREAKKKSNPVPLDNPFHAPSQKRHSSDNLFYNTSATHDVSSTPMKPSFSSSSATSNTTDDSRPMQKPSIVSVDKPTRHMRELETYFKEESYEQESIKSWLPENPVIRNYLPDSETVNTVNDATFRQPILSKLDNAKTINKYFNPDEYFKSLPFEGIFNDVSAPSVIGLDKMYSIDESKRLETRATHIEKQYNCSADFESEVEEKFRKLELSSAPQTIYSEGGELTSISILPPDWKPKRLPVTKESPLDEEVFAQVLPMDGFHYPRYVLDVFEDEEEAHRRRGAPWTFDSKQVVMLYDVLKATCFPLPKGHNLDALSTLKRHQTHIPAVLAPSFDHSLKDPSKNGILIPSSVRIVLFEGLYVLMDNSISPWCLMADSLMNNTQFTTSWFVAVPRRVARKRVAKRHLRSGICYSFHEAVERFDYNDLINGSYAMGNSCGPRLIVFSVDEEDA